MADLPETDNVNVAQAAVALEILSKALEYLATEDINESNVQNYVTIFVNAYVKGLRAIQKNELMSK
jgi:hypothetical protein